ncbi:MAG: LytR family transcriptional regulator [Cyanobacteria bacterium K_Offshore_surface_m2_239]|nr:LytR family transcriptional regulator [Cyanobacteria bacterium K_Offshore_surface_m2_239]
MAARRARRPSSSPQRPEGAEAPRSRRRWAWPGWGMAGLAVAGAVVGTGALALVWPKPDRSLALREEVTAATLAPKPRDSITVLVIGSDAETLSGATNQAAPAGPANSDTLLLVRVNRQGPLQVLQLPSELALSLPGRSEPVALGEIYRQGGAQLTREVVRELLELKDEAPERFIVVPRQALRTLVDGVGGVEVSPPRRMAYKDKSLGYTIDLQSGLQRLSGARVEQMVRFRDKWLGESGRRANQQVVLQGLRERLTQPGQLAQLPALVSAMSSQVETNLSPREMLSLLASALDNPEPMRIQTLPLKPATKEFSQLRQLEANAPRPLWPKP